MSENNLYKNDTCPRCFDIKRVNKTKPARVVMVDHCSNCGFTIEQIYNTKDDLLVEVKEEFLSLGLEEQLAVALLDILSVIQITERKESSAKLDPNIWNNILSIIQEVEPLIFIVFARSEALSNLLDKAGYTR